MLTGKSLERVDLPSSFSLKWFCLTGHNIKVRFLQLEIILIVWIWFFHSQKPSRNKYFTYLILTSAKLNRIGYLLIYILHWRIAVRNQSTKKLGFVKHFFLPYNFEIFQPVVMKTNSWENQHIQNKTNIKFCFLIHTAFFPDSLA